MKATLLVIDDDPSLVNLMQANFQELGCRVIFGYDGQMAIDLAKTHVPDLIILDVNMPMTNGLKAMESIRQNEKTRDIPIILLTGETSERVIPQTQGAGRVTHIKKPIDLEEINALVTQLLQKYPPASPQQG